MLKKKKIGMIVWGAIIAVIGAIFMLSSQGEEAVVIIGLIITLLGAGLLVPGIILAVKTTGYNNRLLAENQGYSWATNCVTCGREVRCKIQNFQIHRNYPEGFIYCPVCKHPISRNAFVKVPDSNMPY